MSSEKATEELGELRDQSLEGKSSGSATRKAPQYRFICSIKEDHGKAVYCVSFCNVGPTYENYFAAVGGNRVTIYECIPDGNVSVVQVFEDEDVEESYFACTWAFDEMSETPLLTIGGLRGIIKLIDCTTQSVVMTLIGHGNAINDLTYHPVDPSLLFSASKDESLRLWNTLTGCCIAIFAGHQGHRDEVLSCDVHILGKSLLSSGMDNTIKIWSLQEEKTQRAMKASYTDPRPADRPFETQFIQFPVFSTSKVHADYVDCVRWVGNLILSKSTEDKIRLWKPNMSRGRDGVTLVREYTLPHADIWFMKFTLDSELELLAAGNKVGKLCIWRVDDNKGSECTKLAHPNCKTPIRKVAYSESGKTLLCCCDDSTIWRWDRL